jgi:hypothetical protein
MVAMFCICAIVTDVGTGTNADAEGFP